MTFFLNSHFGLSRSNDNRPLNFEAATSKFGNHSWTFVSSPQRGKVDLCMTNGSKVLIYLTLLYFLLQYIQEYSKIWNIAKSNKSKLCNCLSYRALPFQGDEPNFHGWLPNFEVTASKFRGRLSFDLNDLERPKWEFKKMSWHNPVSPIDAKKASLFLCNFFWVSLDLQVKV